MRVSLMSNPAVVDFIRCLADKFESTSHDECICQRTEAVEPHIMLILNDNFYVGIEFLRVGFHQAKQT